MSRKTVAGQWRTKSVPLDKMHIRSRHAQREKINESRVDHLFANFDLDKLGMPELSEHEDGEYYILDGQHRIEALKRWLGPGWETQQIQCRVYSGLSDEQEAERFLSLNDTLAVNTFDKFRVAVQAGREDEVHINAIVSGAGLCVSRDKVPGAIGAVGTLKRVYRRSDGGVLARTLRIIRDAYGDSGFSAAVIDGIGHLCHRYNGTLDEETAIKRLGNAHGGVHGLLGKAEVLHKQTGNQRGQCVAAAAVEIINKGKGGKKLPGWWRADCE